MNEATGEFEVRVVYGSMRIGFGDELGCDGFWPLDTPNDRLGWQEVTSGGDVGVREPDAAGARSGGVVVTLRDGG
jgi:hypothetical protein